MTVYEIVTDKIVKQLEAGTIPWRKPWTGGAQGMPKNLVSGKPYRGINVMLLGLAGFNSPYWLTFNQCKQLGGKVKTGETATMVVFFKPLKKKEKDKDGVEKDKTIPMLRYYKVFNTDQTEGLKVPEMDTVETFEHDRIEACEKVVSGMPKPPTIEHGRGRASYSPSSDTVCMPNKENFETAEGYYCTLFHELVHSTGHDSRLNRKTVGVANFGNKDYSKEELIAEMGAAFLSAFTGIDTATQENSSAYIANWIGVLRGDSRLAVTAASAGQKASDYILQVATATP